MTASDAARVVARIDGVLCADCTIAAVDVQFSTTRVPDDLTAAIDCGRLSVVMGRSTLCVRFTTSHPPPGFGTTCLLLALAVFSPPFISSLLRAPSHASVRPARSTRMPTRDGRLRDTKQS